jgi:hypothetical protein
MGLVFMEVALMETLVIIMKMYRVMMVLVFFRVAAMRTHAIIIPRPDAIMAPAYTPPHLATTSTQIPLTIKLEPTAHAQGSCWVAPIQTLAISTR